MALQFWSSQMVSVKSKEEFPYVFPIDGTSL
jgi:hypothetical protein